MNLHFTLRRFFPALAFTIFFFSYSQAQIITTVAGGWLGNGDSTTHFGILPAGIAVDTSGNYYFCAQNDVVYKVTNGSGILTVVAGNGSRGYSGDGGPATAAMLNAPNGIALDRSGNLYIADMYNSRIRMVAAGTGIISTVAGDSIAGYNGDGIRATSASLDEPTAIAVDRSGNLYMTDANSRIRKVTAGTGIITTVAGNGHSGYSGDGGPADSAELSNPFGIAVDSSGNLYITDNGNSRIRKVNISTGIITTIAGTGTYGYSGDGGPADSAEIAPSSSISPDRNGNLFIADFGNNRIRRIDAGTGVISTVAGNGSAGYSGDGGLADTAELYHPYSVAIDNSGNIYIADYNNFIRMVAGGSGIITTVAGNGTPGCSGDNRAATGAELYFPHSIVVDASGNLLIADLSGGRIRRVAVGTGIITTIAGGGHSGLGDGGPADSAEIGPQAIAIDRSGNYYIADLSFNRIRKVDIGTGIISTVAGDGTDGYSGDGGLAVSAQLAYITGVAVDSAGNLYIADFYNHRIRMVAAGTGIITTIAGNGTQGYSGDGGLAISATEGFPSGVAVDSAGNLYIAGDVSIRRVAIGTGIITTVAGNGTYGYSGDGGLATAAALYGPQGIKIDGMGNLYIAESQDNRIRKVAAGTGIITTVAGDGIIGCSGDGGSPSLAALNYPTDVAVDRHGNLYIADFNNNRIRKVGNICANAHFTLQPSNTPRLWYVLNQCTGAGPLTYSWTWGDTSRADTGATPSHTYADSGYYTICVTVTDSLGCNSTYCDSNAYIYKSQSGQIIQVDVVNQIPNGLSEITTDRIQIYPNPNSGTFTLETNHMAGEEYIITDMLGQIIQEKTITSDKQHIDMGASAAGVYTLMLRGKSGAVRVVLR